MIFLLIYIKWSNRAFSLMHTFDLSAESTFGRQ